MLTYIKLSKKPDSFRRFTGLTVEEFDKLYSFVKDKYKEYEKKRLDRKDREKSIGQGRKFDLDVKDRLLMLLFYYRSYASYELTGYLFHLHNSNVCRNIRYLEPLVKACIPLPEKIHKQTKKIGDIEELLEFFPEMKAFLDATEQEIPRPKNKRRRKSHYSGKKKRHTVKTQLIANKNGLIVHKTNYHKGREHDYNVLKKTSPKIPEDVEVITDLGYQGIKDDFPDMKSRLPIKKSKGRKLSKKSRRFNKEIGRERIIVEHTISRIKKFRIIGDEFRNRLKSYNTKMSIVTGLVNFRLMIKNEMDVMRFVV
ncbi:MAG: transposase family protein [Candidatus Aenigmatarchaeota archaeon]